MIFPTEQNWIEWEIDKELHKFFLLRWQEIFDENTFDSWQLRSCNVKTILHEILETLNTVDKVHASHPNILILIREARQIAHEDIIISKYFAYISDYLETLKSEYDKTIKKDKNIDKFRKLVNVIIGNLSKYQNKLVSELKELILRPPKEYEDKIYSLTMALGIEFKSAGYSTLLLRESFNLLTNKENGIFLERFVKLTEQFSKKEHWHSCYFFVSWPGKFPVFRENDIQLIDNHPKHKSSDEETEFYGQDPQAKIVKIRIKSFDYYSARVQAERKLQSLFALNMLYKPTKKAAIKHQKALVISEENNFKKCINPDSSNSKYIRDARNAENNIAQLWSLSEHLSSQDADQLSASLQYHKMAILSPTDEARLVNLWIAVESLVQDGGENIIDRITSYIPSSVTIGYVYLMMKAIPIDIRTVWRGLDTESLRSKLSDSSKYTLHPFDLLKILLDKKNGELATEFLSFIQGNPLLIYRISYLRKDIFGDPKILLEKLERHEKNIAWQIRRIYRARNYVMHKGVCPLQTRQIIQHLHSYYIVTIHNLIHDLKINSEWSINAALEHRLRLYAYFKKMLKSNADITPEALFNPYLILFFNAPGLKPSPLGEKL